MNSDLSIKFLVSGLLNSYVDTNSDTEWLLFNDFMNVFEDFDNLWHDDNFFNNFFKNVWNFDNFLYSAVNWDNLFFESIDNLELVRNLVSDVSFEDEIVFFNYFILVNNNFLNLSCILFNSHNLFLHYRYLDNFLLNYWHFNHFFFDWFNNIVNFN